VFREDTLIKDVIAARPGAGAVLASYGLSCGSCLAASMETLSDAANVHDVPVGQLLAELNALDSTTNHGREPLDG
jgi:hybrid cluster-associated redox disulfide protein